MTRSLIVRAVAAVLLSSTGAVPAPGDLGNVDYIGPAITVDALEDHEQKRADAAFEAMEAAIAAGSFRPAERQAKHSVEDAFVFHDEEGVIYLWQAARSCTAVVTPHNPALITPTSGHLPRLSATVRAELKGCTSRLPFDAYIHREQSGSVTEVARSAVLYVNPNSSTTTTMTRQCVNTARTTYRAIGRITAVGGDIPGNSAALNCGV